MAQTTETSPQRQAATPPAAPPRGQPDPLPDDGTPLDFALAYAGRGIHVFPAHFAVDGRCSCGNPTCESVAKHPLTVHGERDATIDEATIQRWWQRRPRANVAIATGPSRLVVIDIDPEKGGDESFHALEGNLGPFATTWEVVTGGDGRHLYYLAPDGLSLPSRIGFLDGVDVRASTGYVIAPPSIHKSGRRYEWELSHHPDDIPIAMLPASLAAALRDQGERRAAREIPEVITEGSRNSTLYSVSCALRWRGLVQPEIEAAILVMNEIRCRPPLDRGEVLQIIASACRRPIGQLPSHPQPHAPDPVQTHWSGLKTVQGKRTLRDIAQGGGRCPR